MVKFQFQGVEFRCEVSTTTSTTILISSVPPPIHMFIGQFGAADARRRNAEKYADLAEAYRRLGFSVTLDAVCVGALGSWDPANDSILRRLGIPRSRLNGLKRMACR